MKRTEMKNGKKKSRRDDGAVYIWLTGLATAAGLLMIGLLLILLVVNGLGTFWPAQLIVFHLNDGKKILGEIWETEAYRPAPNEPERNRLRVKIANRDFYGLDFKWIEASDIQSQEVAAGAYVLERRSWGNFFGYVSGLTLQGEAIAVTPEQTSRLLPRYLAEAQNIYSRIRDIEKADIGVINYQIEKRRLQIKRMRLGQKSAPAEKEKIAALEQEIRRYEAQYAALEDSLSVLRARGQGYQIRLQTIDGQTKGLPLTKVVRAFQPAQLGLAGKIQLYLAHAWEFVSGEPREANTEGGVFPAIFGTVLMVMLMSIAVVPLGVLSAVYMREYAKQGPLLNAVRIAVNNLAGVPSIVYGIFGLGFFIYTVGGSIDRLFFPESLPTPTYGTGGILWASLTLALLTLPVVIVTTEEGLAAVPRSMRESSLALGATKFETLWRIILPSASPAIFTGLILAISRAAGEVAPLMLTGVVKLAPSLPLDGTFPFLHLDRKFMHLGFHIYDVGFQSPNVEAALPMVYATTLLLVLIVLVFNLAAILLRNRLRARFSISKL